MVWLGTLVFVFLTNIVVCSSLTFFNVPPNSYASVATPPQSFSSADGSVISCPTMLMRQQWNNVDFSAFNRNLSLFNEPQNGCGTLTPGSKGQAYGVFKDYASCQYGYQQRNAQTAGYAAVVGLDFGTDFFMLFLYQQPPFDYGIPVVGGQGENQLPQFDQFGGCNAVVGGFMPNPNITVNLDFPQNNLLYVDAISFTGGIYNIMYIGFSFNLFLMILSSMKFAVFVFHEQRIQLSIPQVVLFFCFMTGLFSVIISFGGSQGTYGTFLDFPWRFFELWGFSFAFSACLVLSLYFREISVLTSASSVSKLSIMKIPTIVVLGILWAATITYSFIAAFPPPGFVSLGGSFVQLVLAVYCLISAMTLFASVFGTVSLAMNIDPSQKTFWGIVTVLIISNLATIFLIITAILNIVLDFYIGGWGGPTGEQITGFQWTWILTSLELLGPCFTCIALCFIFRISVSKEIELSASGTSSTMSSARSNSSSSQSSSSRSEPVVEL